MAELLRYVNRGLKHEYRKWYAWDPGVEAERREQAKDQEDDTTAPVLANKHVDGGSQTAIVMVSIQYLAKARSCALQHDMQYPSNPDELLCEHSRKRDISISQH